MHLFRRQAGDVTPYDPVLTKRGLSVLNWIGLALCIFFVGLRTWVQYRSTKRLYSNDVLIFIAMGCHIGAVITCQLVIPSMYGVEEAKLVLARLGPSAVDLDMVNTFETFLPHQFALLFLLWTTLWCVKFSLLIFFWRLFDSVRTKARVFWWVMIFVTAATFTTTVFLQLFACGSPQNFMRMTGCSTDRKLYLSNLVFLFSAGTDIAGDVLILLIPFPLLWKLRTTQRQKAILVGIFLLPLTPIIFGVVRLVLCNPVASAVDVVKFQLYSLLENTAAIITACLPSLRLFVTGSCLNTKVTVPGYYSDMSGKKSRGTHRGVNSIPLGSHISHTGNEPFDFRNFSRIESEEEAAIANQRAPFKGVMVTKGFEVLEYGPNEAVAR